MGAIVAVGLVIAFFWVIIKVLSKLAKVISESSPSAPAKAQPSISIRIEGPGVGRPDDPETGAIAAAPRGGWILNPKAPFNLTVTDIDEASAKEVKRVLDNYDPERSLENIVVTSGLRCREIDEYVAMFRPLYLRQIEQLTTASKEWQAAAAPDRLDLLREIQEEALDSLGVRPDCDLLSLFSDESEKDRVQFLARKYGTDQLRVYLHEVETSGKVKRIPADHRYRHTYEDFVAAGLAKRGADIALRDILDSLTLKELNAISDATGHAHFARKAQSIEYLLSLNGIDRMVPEHVALRELFQLGRPTGGIENLEMEAARQFLDKSREVVRLLRQTYQSSRNALMEIDDQYVKGWEIYAAVDCCPLCKRISSKKYPKNRRPRIPAHVGCRCGLQRTLTFDQV